MFEVPPQYHGREQTYLKHLVLKHYLESWAQKLGSVAKKRQVALWYVDCFAGPWKSHVENNEDTSPFIALKVLNDAAKAWRERSLAVQPRALFVEQDPKAFSALEQVIEENRGIVSVEAISGEFGASIPKIQSRLGEDAAFFFVDPTGWKGAGMELIASLVQHLRRDVLINVMVHHISRFKDSTRLEFIGDQMQEFFGLSEPELPELPTEADMMEFYREQLKQRSGLPYVAHLRIPDPTAKRTYFRLVIGGHHEKVLELFRNIEKKVVGTIGGVVRDDARRRKVEKISGQFTIPLGTPDYDYELQKRSDLAQASDMIRALLQERGGFAAFRDVWPSMLERFHITKPELARRAVELANEELIGIKGLGERERTAKDEHILFLR